MSRDQISWSARFWTLTAVAQIAIATATKAEDPGNLFFHDDYNKAIQEAKLTKKPIFLEFRCAP